MKPTGTIASTHANQARVRARLQFYRPWKMVYCTGHATRRAKCRATTSGPAEDADSAAQNSVKKRAADLVKLQKELDEQMAQLKTDLAMLSPEERNQVGALLQTTSLPETIKTQNLDPRNASQPGIAEEPIIAPQTPKTASFKANEDADSSDDTQDKRKQTGGPEADASAEMKRNFVEIPSEIRKMLEEAGVLDAMDWNGVPATAPNSGEGTDSAASSQDPSDRAGNESMDDIEDDEYVDGDDEEFEPGKGVAEMVRMLERGEPLPPDPRYKGLEIESSEAFRKRMLLLQQAFEAQDLPKKLWKISEEDYKKVVNEKFETNFKPGEKPEITEVQPAPDFPDPLHRKHFDRAQWILFLYRRAYLLPHADSAALQLAHAGLLSEDLVFEDPVMESLGPVPYLDYMTRLANAGGVVELAHIWSELGTEEPHPRWTVWVDLWLSLPYPDWYKTYMSIHTKFDDPPNLSKGRSFVDPYEPVTDTWKPPPLRYPKGRIKLEDLQKPKQKKKVPRIGETFAKDMGKSTQTQKGGKLHNVSARGGKEQEEPVKRRYAQARLDEDAYDRGYQPQDSPAGQKTEAEMFAERARAEADRLRRLQDSLEAFCMDRMQPPTYESEPEISPEVDSVHLGTMRECITRAQQEGVKRESFSSTHRRFQFLDADGRSSPRRSRRLLDHSVEYRDKNTVRSKSPWQPYLAALPPTAQVTTSGGLSKRQRLLSKQQITIADKSSIRAQKGNMTGEKFVLPGSPFAASVAESDIIEDLIPGNYTVFSYRMSKSLSAESLTEKELPEFPVCQDIGQAWRSGNWFCIPVTIGHKIDNDLGQVTGIHAVWGPIMGHAIGTPRDILDVYGRQLRLWEDEDPACQRVKVYASDLG